MSSFSSSNIFVLFLYEKRVKFKVFYRRSFCHFVVGDGHKYVSRMNFSFVDYNLFQAKKIKKKK